MSLGDTARSQWRRPGSMLEALVFAAGSAVILVMVFQVIDYWTPRPRAMWARKEEALIVVGGTLLMTASFQLAQRRHLGRDILFPRGRRLLRSLMLGGACALAFCVLAPVLRYPLDFPGVLLAAWAIPFLGARLLWSVTDPDDL